MQCTAIAHVSSPQPSLCLAMPLGRPLCAASFSLTARRFLRAIASCRACIAALGLEGRERRVWCSHQWTRRQCGPRVSPCRWRGKFA
eukprot:2504894-Pleurochrysis_carterae.AAC.1